MFDQAKSSLSSINCLIYQSTLAQSTLAKSTLAQSTLDQSIIYHYLQLSTTSRGYPCLAHVQPFLSLCLCLFLSVSAFAQVFIVFHYLFSCDLKSVLFWTFIQEKIRCKTCFARLVLFVIAQFPISLYSNQGILKKLKKC